MNTPQEYSDELLNAYIDGELDKEETGRLLDELRYNTELSTRITDLQKVREMVRYAYHEKVPASTHSDGNTRSTKTKMAFAASILLSLGMALGWSLHLHSQPSHGIMDIAEAIQLAPASTHASDDIKMVLHVTTDKQHKLETILDEAEKFLSQNENNNKKVQMDIITNGKGLKLLQAKHSPFSQRISELQQRYQNLTFKACQKAILRARSRAGKDEKIEMLPETVTVPSALGEIMKKQRDGWSYIKI